MEAKEWSVSIYITEDETTTRARAVLVADGGSRVTGKGAARRNPADRPVPEIGDELAVSRALADLASRLHGVASSDIAHLAGPA
ncbi:DUF1876 domain-containing protein [Actinomadura barringtoniae]|uniref:DUF1876 domain-containing protein n=1 Tax=Actinomadura barringtoniae TaxID=1427535 RepID=A0A939T3D2_9ACTN|nr:DUF1876 domain-containing protein [Actinomadura barringtoniae]MBO2447953.1 DUF1876 domain-containing protein [Actinomadura barringtoniae]